MGACYREWTVDKSTDIYDKIAGKKKVGTAVKGTKVIGLTGGWVNVKLKSGATGWTKEHENFGDKDSCG